ncbi:MAG: hypothetical protein DI582_07010 [Azospirillum brasilense]|nr:MAG: hypothetical protein DI582_07010 [Azospirillum brasilense]
MAHPTDPKVKPEAVTQCEKATEALLFDGPTLRTDRFEALAKSAAWREAFGAFLDGKPVEQTSKPELLNYMSAVLGTSGSRRLMGELTAQMTQHTIPIGFEPAYDIFYEQTMPTKTRELPAASTRSLFSQLDNAQLQQVVSRAEPGMFAQAAASTLSARLIPPASPKPNRDAEAWATTSEQRGNHVIDAMDAVMRDPEALKARLAAGQFRSPWAQRVQAEAGEPETHHGRG